MATQRQMAGGQRRSLKAIQRKLEAMAAEWGEVDAYNESVLQQLAQKVEEMAESLVPDE